MNPQQIFVIYIDTLLNLAPNLHTYMPNTSYVKVGPVIYKLHLNNKQVASYKNTLEHARYKCYIDVPYRL